ncbi:GNAT family N-acetyltransferase [Cellulomonas sp. zg-ZUI222]|uniref:GNAT family N-acetyltransferase n=1 Tax=Cellulomonas wangleii TaxID=2816956 RepID=A0ABX8D4H8_9CELL|nr:MULTISPECIES: GNAT family N-acetyltransferase [Cellulomonas]MBO0898636.1 GNAT family N-acetyltransferase [Cellulomonas sp. zg-ZUI22]MBO0919498.1 GNAT family N-acetyltransferase [Cellulomonas wangleii]MBO0924362.1 GNAT family N-acetyltransferase [Cellulomonas wangleii]QVI62364.1 GNAT family N-acetyltransferase [Cellulomonas wangleii]
MYPGQRLSRMDVEMRKGLTVHSAPPDNVVHMAGFADFRPGAEHRPAQVAVRPAALGDVDAMQEIQRRAGRPAHPDAYRRAVENPDCCVLVAECSSQAGDPITVGGAQTYLHAAVVDAAPTGHYLGGVTVDPSWRRRGIALALTEVRVQWIADRADEVFYVVNPRNLASIELHRRWSYEEVMRSSHLTGVEFSGGVGILMHAALAERAASDDAVLR